ncbi:MAG: hypothetical protein IT514_08105 [Burkholderiales bacterium]|nr:hypothetical protein [Burkholderiales bacterium]
MRPPPIGTAADLGIFLRERALLIAQKCAIDYVRGKTGLASYALFTEKPFLDALDVCRWETFAAVLGDLAILAEGVLRPGLPLQQHARARAALLRLHEEALTSLPPPAHRAEGWTGMTGAFAPRLEAACAGPPRQALEVADHSARRLFDTLPIHVNMRELDEPVIYGAVRFRMVAVRDEMRRRFAVAQLACALCA